MVNEKNKRYFVRDIKEQFESRKKKRFFQKELQELVCYLSALMTTQRHGWTYHNRFWMRRSDSTVMSIGIQEKTKP